MKNTCRVGRIITHFCPTGPVFVEKIHLLQRWCTGCWSPGDETWSRLAPPHTLPPCKTDSWGQQTPVRQQRLMLGNKNSGTTTKIHVGQEKTQEGQQRSMLGKNNSGRTTKIHAGQEKTQEGQQRLTLANKNSGQSTFRAHRPRFKSPRQSAFRAHRPRFKSPTQSSFRAHRPRFKSPRQSSFRAHRPRFKSSRQSSFRAHRTRFKSPRQSAFRAHRPRFKSHRQSSFRSHQTLIQIPCSKPFPKLHYGDSSVLAIQMTDPNRQGEETPTLTFSTPAQPPDPQRSGSLPATVAMTLSIWNHTKGMWQPSI